MVSQPVEHGLHIGQMKLAWRPASLGYKLVARLNVHDEAHLMAGFAEVFGTWSLPDGSTLDRTATADVYGRVKFPLHYPVAGAYQFCVTDMVKAGHVYDPAANHVGPCLSITPPPARERVPVR